VNPIIAEAVTPIRPGSFPGTILCGPSGVGKSTMLRCMSLGGDAGAGPGVWGI